MRHVPVFVPFLLAALIWGSTWIVIRDQLAEVPPAWSISYRFAIASVVLAGAMRLGGAELRIDRQGHALAACFGILQFFLNFNFVYHAEYYSTSGIVALAYSLLFIPNAILGRLFLKQRLSTRFLLGSAIAVAGIGLLLPEEFGRVATPASDLALGAGLTLLGLLSISCANIIQGSPAAKQYPAITVVAWGMIYGTAATTLWALIVDGSPVVEARTGYWLGLLYLAIAGTAVTFTLYYHVLRAIGAARAAYVALLIPVIALALSTAFEGYSWSLTAALGAALAMTGLIIVLTEGRGAAVCEAERRRRILGIISKGASDVAEAILPRSVAGKI